MSLELGTLLSDFVEEFGDGDSRAVQVGGASGFCVPRKKFKIQLLDSREYLPVVP
jgi:[NiFe] hydrogenase diaphorase moiety large subunit